MDPIISIISGLTVGVFGTGGVVAGFKVWTEWQSTKALRKSETTSQAAARDDAREESAFTRMERAMERMDKELTRTALEREQDRIRIADLEASQQNLAEENRVFRHVILGVMNRLRRKPPDPPEAILAFILEHLPSLRKDES